MDNLLHNTPVGRGGNNPRPLGWLVLWVLWSIWYTIGPPVSQPLSPFSHSGMHFSQSLPFTATAKALLNASIKIFGIKWYSSRSPWRMTLMHLMISYMLPNTVLFIHVWFCAHQRASISTTSVMAIISFYSTEHWMWQASRMIPQTCLLSYSLTQCTATSLLPSPLHSWENSSARILSKSLACSYNTRLSWLHAK